MSYQNGGVEMKPSYDDETEPLTKTTSPKEAVRWNSLPNETKGDPAGRSWLVAMASILAGLLLGTLLVVFTKGKQKVSEQVVLPKDVVYRPFCEYHDGNNVKLIQTSMQQASQQWSLQYCYQAPHPRRFRPQPQSSTTLLNEFQAPDAVLQVNFSTKPFQGRTILGFGGAFTEASALNYNRLTQKGKDAVMDLLFGKNGLGYAIGRVHINSCDFSLQSYSFDDTEDDFELDDFDIGVHHDVATGMVDMALRATSVLRSEWATSSSDDGMDGNLRLFASPWSPPAWMKRPTKKDRKDAVHAQNMTFSTEPNCLREGTGPKSRYAAAWALYFSKFITAYQNLGLPMWAVTVQNEPEFPAPWEACAYEPKNEAEFVGYHLGPRLRKDHPETKLLIFDHNKDHINTWANALLSDPVASPYVDGTGYHWYAGGMDRLLDGALGAANLHRFHNTLDKYNVTSNHLLLGTESCHCPTTSYAGGDMEITWARAERYAHSILADLAAGSNGWLEWNLILDGIGGPNHLGNICEASILSVPHRSMDATPDIPPLPSFEKSKPFGNRSVGDGRTREELNVLGFPAKFLDVGVAVQPIYFYMGHISRYVRPGSEAVMGLVTESAGPGKTFRPEGQVVQGGGQNDLARTGVEITVWPCEGSTRQQFSWNFEGKRHIQVFGHDWLGKPTESCIGRKPEKSLLGLTLTSCKKWAGAGVFELIPLADDDKGRYNIVLKNDPSKRDQCLIIRPLENGGGAYGPRGGAQVTTGDCFHESAKWKLDAESGEASSTFFADENGDNEVCMTTGWPFLQIGAFLTPNGETPKTVVILNEANDAANFALKDENKLLLTGSIPGRSIQTVLLD